MKHPPFFLTLVFPCVCLAAIAVFSGCGPDSWACKLGHGYAIQDVDGQVAIIKPGQESFRAHANDEIVDVYWTDGDRFAVKLLKRPVSVQASPQATENPYLLIDMLTDATQRFATEKELLAALPPNATLKWNIPSPPYGCVCCSALILPAFLPLALAAQQRRPRLLDADLF